MTSPPSSSLAGHDRFLIHRPFDAVPAADFEIGTLSSLPANQQLSTTLSKIREGFMKGSLPYDIFSPDMAAISRLLYDEPAGPPLVVRDVRFGESQAVPGGAMSVPLRLLASVGDAQEAAVPRAATGLILLSPGDKGAWVVEHLELDIEALLREYADWGSWDPYTRTRTGSGSANGDE
ncbi:MAG: hypothetical protein JXM71_08925 [Spirochaetales bacterium]|nr:hypothetical protein [Spirochaetales bacterium]